MRIKLNNLTALHWLIVVPAMVLFFFIGFFTHSASTPDVKNLTGRIGPGGFNLNERISVGDFDQDQQLDEAYLSSSGRQKNIFLRFGNSLATRISFPTETSTEGFLWASDIDHDNDLDLIWATSDAKNFCIWLGDGTGNFQQAAASAEYSLAITKLVGRGTLPALDSAPASELWAQANDSSRIFITESKYFCHCLSSSIASFYPIQFQSFSALPFIQNRAPPLIASIS